MQRGQHQVAGQGRLCGNLRSFRIADFADHHDVRVLPQQGAERPGESEPGFVTDLELIDPRQGVFHRIFDGADVNLRRIQFLERCVKRRCLAAARRAGYQQNAVGKANDFSPLLKRVITEAEFFQTHRRFFIVDDANDDLFAPFTRHGADAQIDGPLFH